MSINWICECRTTFKLSTPLCPSCGKPPGKLKARLKTPTGWKTLVTPDLKKAQEFEGQQKAVVKARREGRREGAKLRGELRANSKPTTPTLTQVFDLYINEVSETKRSWKDDQGRWNRYLKGLGPLPLDAVTPELIQKVLNAMKPHPKFRGRTEPLSPATRRQVFTLVRHLFNWARRKRLWNGDNPTAFLDPIKVDNKRYRFYTPAEIGALFASFRKEKDRLAEFTIRFLLLTGRRRGEVLKLEPQDIDLERSTATFKHTKPGKKQVVPISPEALWLAEQGMKIGGPRVFPWGAPHQFDTAWERIRNRAGLKDAKLHDLRHTFASMAVSHGESLYTVGGLLGHADPKTTQRYAHLQPEAMRRAANKVEKLFNTDVRFMVTQPTEGDEF